MGEATRRPVHVLPTLLAVIALVAGCGGPSPTPSGPTTSPAPSTAVTGPTSPPSTPPGPTPTPDPSGWSPVSLADMPQVATLEPLTAGPAAVARDTAFRLRSLDGRSPTELAARLVVQPSAVLNIVSTDGDTAILKPAQPLAARTTYRISLTREDGSAEASWVAQAGGPLQITETTPGDASTKVPLTTGIEIRFDQYGVTADDLSHHFSIRPAVAGRFVAAGQALAFVPSSPLAKGRLYTVTISRGLPLPGTGEVLASDYTFRFETAAKAASPVLSWFPQALVDSSTASVPEIAVDFSVPDGSSTPRAMPVTVHRVDDMAAAQSAWRAILAAPEWTRVSTAEAVPTSGLTRIFQGTVSLRSIEDATTRWFSLPTRLGAGWYVVTGRWGGVPRQTLLQVTDLATFAMVSTDRTLVWVNDLRTKAAVTDAVVTVNAADFARTDTRGLAVGPTPAGLGERADDAVVVVRSGSRTAFYPLATERACGECGDGTTYGDAETGPDARPLGDDWWRLFYTDRSAYRTTDTINVWGVARARDTRNAPATVRLTLTSIDGGATPIATATVAPDRAGAFAGNLALRDVPVGEYSVRLAVDDTVIAESWVQVATIAKPAWQLSVDVTPHAIIRGASVSVRADASFFEGTPVAGTPVNFSANSDSQTRRTDASGRAIAAFRVGSEYCRQQCDTGIDVAATLPEEGEIWTTADAMVFTADGYVDVDATLSGTRLTISGKVSGLALERFEVPGANLWDVNPRSGGRAGARVVLALTESWSVRVAAGTRYDFVTKQVVPVYEYEDRERQITAPVLTTAADGTFQARLDVRGGNRSYHVTASYADPQGRETSAEVWASDPSVAGPATDADPTLSNAGTHPEGEGYKVGDTVRVRFSGGTANPPVARYLYAISQRGLRYVTVGTTPTFRTTFDAAALPSISITAVRFTGLGYETAISAYTAHAALDANKITVEVKPDRERYAPGDKAALSVRTLGPDGNPVPASVYVDVVDEKLYAMHLAYDKEPLADLYQTVGNGLVSVMRSHLTPSDVAFRPNRDTTGGQGGDTMRDDFRDWLVATLVTTDAAGRATVPVALSDDLTSWHVAAYAVDTSLRAGSSVTRLAVGLPFFVEATLQPDYLKGERPVLRIRGFGTGLQAGDRVMFTVSSDTLPLAPTTATAKAFEAAEVALPALPLGSHTIRISGTARGQSDVLVRTFTVVASRSVRATTSWEPLAAAIGVKAGDRGALTKVLLVDAGRGRVVPALYELGALSGGRSDQALAADLANRVLAESFGLETAGSTSDRAVGRFATEGGGLAILPYGSWNLDVTALAAMARNPQVNAAALRTALATVAFDDHARRDRRLLALAGLAGLGDPVLGEVRAAAAATGLTIPEEASLALAALYAGDEALAAKLERQMLKDHGRAYGPWLRLDTGQAERDIVTTARLAIVAASLGDPAAAKLDAWLEGQSPTTTLIVLERALAASGWAHRVGGASAAAAVTVDGVRREVRIEPGQPASVALTAAQAASARLEPVSGSVLVVTSREVPTDAASLTKPSGVSITRTISPAGQIGASDRVVVTIRVTLSAAARKAAWRVVDWAPSGLKPVGGDRWSTSSSSTAWIVGPDSVDGQRVEASIGGNAKVGTWTLRYVARVVSPGEYRWEGSVIQSATAPDHGIVLSPKTITIRGTTGS